MWGSFFASALVTVLFLYVPGFLLLRALRVSRIVSIVCAPFVTIPLYVILTIVYSKMGIFCSWAVLFMPALVASIVLYAIAFFIGRGKEPLLDLPMLPMGKRSRGFDWLCLGLYLVVGLAVATNIYARSLDGADSFIQAFDNVHHLGTTFGFVQSGDWSPFNASLYVSEEAARINPLPGSGFYPAAWNCLCAFAVSALGVPVSLAGNAVNYILIGMVFPSCTFLLLRTVFRNRPDIVPFGSIVALSFSAFPWAFLVFGPLYPNMMAFAMVPAAAFCFMAVIAPRALRVSRVVAGVLFCASMLTFLFSQPNAVFTTAVLLAPYCVYRVVLAADHWKLSADKRRLAKAGFFATSVVAIVIIWVALYNAPFLHNVVSHNWPAIERQSQGLADVLFLAFRIPGTQIVLSVLVAIGILYTLRHRRYLWMSCSFAILCLFYIVDVSSNEPVKFLLTGFWYTDSYRVAASTALCAVPLASVGLWMASRGVAHLLRKLTNLSLRNAPIVASCTAVAVFMLVNFYPNFTVPGVSAVATGMGSIAETLDISNSTTRPQVYDADEAAFVEDVEKIVPEGALILNEPDDGSAFAYSVDGLNTYYRYLRTYGDDDETDDSKVIRTRLSSIAADAEVREAVDDVGGTYLLLLDQGEPKGERPYLFTYEGGRNWQGIESVDDDTPGFETVLSRGDMRLYKITATDKAE